MNERKPGGQIHLIRCRDPEEFLTAPAELFGRLPETCLCAGDACSATADMLRKRGTNADHIFDNFPKNKRCAQLGESDETLQRFYDYLRGVCQGPGGGDTRPLILFRFLERLDEAVDLRPIFEALMSTGRQVFIAVPYCYHLDRQEDMPYDIHTL